MDTKAKAAAILVCIYLELLHACLAPVFLMRHVISLMFAFLH